jgi:UDP-glucuronate decarboxylase
MNLGNPDEFKVSELASKVVDITGSKSRVIYEPLPSDDPKMRKPDIEKAKAELNWSPKVALADGLKNTLDRMRKKLDTGG